MKKKINNERPLEIRIYLKPNDRACVVFRKHKVLYRIRICGAEQFLENLHKYRADLGMTPVLELKGTRMRKWVLEMGIIAGGNAVLQVWERAEHELKLRFGWSGAPTDLQRALSR